MTQRNSPHGWGKYLGTLQIICDLLVLNITFLILMHLTPEVTREGRVRLLFLVLNISYLPAIFIYWHKRLKRSIHMDRLLLMAIQSVMIQACVFFATVSFCYLNIPLWFMVKMFCIYAIVIPLTWMAERQIIKTIRRRGRNYVRIIIVGSNHTSVQLLEEINRTDTYGYKFMGFFDNKPHESFNGTLTGTIDDIDDFVRRNHIDEVYYTLSGNKADLMPRVLHIAEDNLAKFYYVPQINRYVTSSFALGSVGSIPVLEPHRNKLENPANRALKRAFDIIFSGTFLLLSPVIFIPVAIAIKLSSPGPVFFKQKRTGYRGIDFTCYKFRTMRVNADADKVQATLDDPRKTRVGEFLRRTSIDELPQFINVFKGDMSVVGPRPHMLKHTEDYRKLISQYMVRHQVKPGVTGWAQVNGLRGVTDQLWKMESRVSHDVWYIEHWNFLLDIKIIVMTVLNAIRGDENAN